MIDLPNVPVSDGTISLIALTALYGVYLVLFVLAIWSTYLRPTPASLPMRISVLSFFCMLLIHTALQFSIWSIEVNGITDDNRKKYNAMTIVENLIPCFSAFLAQGQLTWRCYMLWGRKQWMKRTIPAVIGFGTAIGVFANAAFTRKVAVTYQLLCLWGWWTLIVQSSLSSAVISRIVKNVAARRNKPTQLGSAPPPRPHVTAFRAMIESSFIAWVGVFAYTILNTIFWGRPNSTGLWAASASLFSLLPLFFAIAHSLSVALVGLSNFVAAAPPKRSTLAFAPGATSGADLQTGFVVKLGDQVQMTDLPSPSIRVQHDIMVHKD